MSITVYELIQELAKFKPDTEVKFHVEAEFDADVSAEFDRDNGDDEQDVTVTAKFEEDVDCDDIRDYESYRYGTPHIQINLKY